MKVHEIIGKGNISGVRYGIEVEYENSRLSLQDLEGLHTKWIVVEDGSLRNNGRELVAKHPLTQTGLTKAGEEFVRHRDEVEGNMEFTCRCGLHVHINVRDMTLEQLRTFLYVYATIEPYLENEWNERAMNLFTPSLSKAPMVMRALRIFLGDADTLGALRERWLSKYASVNTLPIFTYGSVEFRMHPSTSSWDDIYRWCQLLNRLRTFSMSYANVYEMLDENRNRDIMWEATQDPRFMCSSDKFTAVGRRNLSYLMGTVV